MAEIVNFDPIKRGEYFDPLTILLKDGNGNPIVLTGATLSMKAKKNARGIEVFNFNPTISDAINGEITVPGFIADYPVENYKYDIFVTINNEPEVYIEGYFPIVESISNPN